MKPPVAAFAAAALSILAAAPAAASEFVVLESTVAKYAPGSILPATEQVQLDASDRLVMVAADGSTRALSGPYSGALEQAGEAAPDALERLTAQQSDPNHVPGAIQAPPWDQE